MTVMSEEMPRPNLLASALIIVLALGARFCLYPYESQDFRDFIAPWIEYIRAHGGILALKDPFSNYNPPYLYLLTLASYAPPAIPSIVLVKSMSVFFDVVAALGCAAVARATRLSPSSQFMVFVSVLFCPTAILNSAAWGQCDSIYGAFIILSVVCLAREMPWKACVLYGIALSFKLQAIFLAPAIVILLSRSRLRWFHLTAIPATYCLLLAPAFYAGRDIPSLVSIYWQQAHNYSSLSMNAPNLYQLFPNTYYRLLYPLGLVGTASFFVVIVALVVAHRVHFTPQRVILVTTLALIGCPFLLPKMHDRYFFGADLMTIVYAFTFPAYYLVPVLVQLASWAAYARFLFDTTTISMPIATAFMGIALSMVVFHFVRDIYLRRTEQPVPIVKVELGTLAQQAQLLVLTAGILAVWVYAHSYPAIRTRTLDLLGIPVTDLSGSLVSSSLLEPVAARQEWGSPLKNRSLDDSSLRIGGHLYSSGIGVHANSTITFNLEKQFRRFSGSVGVPDYLSENSSTTLYFSIVGDGRVLFRSRLFRPKMEIESFNVSVAEVTELQLVVSDAGDGNNADHAAWLEMQLTR